VRHACNPHPQGCNSSLEDAAVLGGVLEQLLGGAPSDPAALGRAVAREYDRARRADAHALQALEQAASYESRKNVVAGELPWRLRLHYERLLLLYRAHRLLAERLPGVLATGRGGYMGISWLLLAPEAHRYGRVLRDMRLAAAGLGALALGGAAGVGALALALAGGVAGGLGM
jgi:hypothetical protein